MKLSEDKIIEWIETHVLWIIGGFTLILVFPWLNQFHWPDRLLFGHPIWDWLDLIVIPVFIIVAANWLNKKQKEREQILLDAQKERELKFLEEQKEREQAFLEAQKIKEDESILNRDQEQALQSYLDAMSTLLLEKQLQSASDFTVINLARSRTITILRYLNNKYLDVKGKGQNRRKGSLVRFLYESGLISGGRPVISLSKANLSYAYMHSGEFYKVNFSEAYLSSADLRNADLRDAFMKDAYLPSARLNHADLRKANLQNTNLKDADLTGAILRRTNLRGANLDGVILDGADLAGAIMPDGSVHE